MAMRYFHALPFSVLIQLPSVHAADLEVGKACPVSYDNQSVGLLVFSKPWFHSSRSNAQYVAGDNATGIGIEIHLVNNAMGHLSQRNIAQCDRYRIIQIRETTARLNQGEKPVQIDVPDAFLTPFYDTFPLEHGYGVHYSPKDVSDKPWSKRPIRAATVSIYDTPYVSDAYGLEGKDIRVTFETCAVCEREQGYDRLLSCGKWGYQRDYMGGMTGWTEPEYLDVQCHAAPSAKFQKTLDLSNRIEYSYWINWR